MKYNFDFFPCNVKMKNWYWIVPNQINQNEYYKADRYILIDSYIINFCEELMQM